MHTPRSISSLVAGLCIAYCGPAGSQESPDEAYVVPETVQAKLLELTRQYKPQAVVSTLERRAETILNAAPAQRQLASSYSTQSLQPNGLWASEFASTAITTGNVARSYTLSLCGLITVTSSGVASTSQDITTAIPVGKLFLPFGFRTTSGFSRTLRLNKLETTASDICAPAPGSEFSYVVASEITTKTSSGQLQTVLDEEEVRCKTSAESEAAAKLLPQFRGNFLDVVCEHKKATGASAKRRFVYLQDSALYLMLMLHEAWGQSTVIYTSVQYAN